MIIVITFRQKNQRTGREEILVSHGIDASTGRNVILPIESPGQIGAKFCPEMGEYVILDSGPHK
ncbi:hypothetical protein JOE11_005345 [Robbsia andropogonis]|uniref:hypothetical protein n=1 Tax=Robbsia andropogonis TaxID=28092 RepID=UPI003D1C3599